MITVKYSCNECGADKILISVPSRKDGENVIDFVQETARIVGVHHSHRKCKAQTVDLMIPMDGPTLGRERRNV